MTTLMWGLVLVPVLWVVVLAGLGVRGGRSSKRVRVGR